MDVTRVGSSQFTGKTAKTISKLSKYTEYKAGGGELVSLYKDTEGAKIARIYYPYYNSTQIIKYKFNPAYPWVSQPVEYLSKVNGRKTYRLSYKNEEWVDKAGKSVLVPGGIPFWNQIPRPVNQ